MWTHRMNILNNDRKLFMDALENSNERHPLQNRVDPFGRLVRTSARGAWMGNRGLIHDENQRIVRAFRLKAWITCRLEFKNRHRAVMTPGRYTELFFLDEATAFSAGHRPCAECRREDYRRFKTAWLLGNPDYGFDEKTPVGKIDEILHGERVDAKGSKITYTALPDQLPNGVFIAHNGRPFTVINPNQIVAWTTAGYGQTMEISPGTEVIVLTPRSIINTFRAGYSPQMTVKNAT
jgi:hypothetical protein